MEEKVYKTMGHAGAFNIVIGICVIVTGIASGVMLIINGARLIKSKAHVLL